MIKVHNWEELSKCKSSNENFILEVYKHGAGWIRDKSTNKGLVYLTTHTFYDKRNADYKTKKLQECGFDVELIPWEE